MRTKSERPVVALLAVVAVVLCLGLVMASWQVSPLTDGNTASAVESNTASVNS